MSIRAKMVCESVFASQWGGAKAIFRCIYDPTLPEDQRFQKATPSGLCEMQIDNPAVMDQIVIGRSYYLDFTPIEPVN